LNLLRTHIFWRPDVRPEPGVSFLSHHQSNAEINEICMLIWPHEDIRRLYVPMNHDLFVIWRMMCKIADSPGFSGKIPTY
jgi:hypothetical protein